MKTCLLPVVLASATIAATVLALVAPQSGVACPRDAGKLGMGVGNGNQDAAQRFVDGRRLGDGNRFASDATANDMPEPQNEWFFRFAIAEMLGGSVVVGLFVVAVGNKLRQFRNLSAIEADLLRCYPELEHPELTLAPVPKEAFAMALIEREGTTMR